jgi:hypothetical protein
MGCDVKLLIDRLNAFRADFILRLMAEKQNFSPEDRKKIAATACYCAELLDQAAERLPKPKEGI